jgi:transposase
LLATRPIDFRKGAHSLAALVQEVLAEDPFSDAVMRRERQSLAES